MSIVITEQSNDRLKDVQAWAWQTRKVKLSLAKCADLIIENSSPSEVDLDKYLYLQNLQEAKKS